MQTRTNNLASGTPVAMRSRRSGFTLIELLIVIALTLTLLALLFGPLVSGFQTTARAQLEAQAHDSGRVLMNQLVRELTSAIALRDTNGGVMNGLVMAKVNANDSTGVEILAHMRGAYTDVVPPQLMFQNSTGIPTNVPTVNDPTTGRNLVLEQKEFSQTTTENPSNPTWLANIGTTVVPVEPDLVTPVAPDNAIIRYFIGLKYPFNLTYTGLVTDTAQAQPYTNIYDNENVSTTDATYGGTDVVKGSLNNTYIMYRAVVRPYSSTGSGTPMVDQTLFDVTTDSAGNQVPVLDDPDFFRIVTDADLLPSTSPYYDHANPTNNTYGVGGTGGTSLTAVHNSRVYHWFKASHALIGVSNLDTLGYLRPGNQLAWVAPITIGATTLLMPSTELDPATQQGTIGLDTDGITPLVPPTITISSGGALSETATPQQTSEPSQGAADSSNYVPTVYKTSQGQIQGYPTITLASAGQYFTTAKAFSTDVGVTTLANGATIAATDLVEYGPFATAPVPPITSGTAAYDISQGSAVAGNTNHIALSYNPSTGSLDFAVAATPPTSSPASADPSNIRNSYWAAVPVPLSTNPSANLAINLSGLSGSPLGAGLNPAARIVVNSEQVRGPDKTPGPTTLAPVVTSTVPPAQYSLVPYTRVSDPGQVGINQYAIDYSTGIVTFAPASAWGADLTSSDPQKNTVLVSYKMQNNTAITSGVLSPASITVSYSSSSLVTITMGIRVYDTSTKLAAFFNQTNTVGIGNGSQ